MAAGSMAQGNASLKNAARIARRNERILIQKNESYTDKYKNHLHTWTDYFSCHAYASTYEAGESGDEVTYEERSVTFEVRYCPEIAAVTSTGYRIVFHGENYNIESIDMMNYQKKTVRIKARREKR